jgi:lipoprotein signal peptidase
MTRPRRPRSWILLGGIAALVVIIDQGTKLLARRTLALHRFVPLLDSWLGLRRTYSLPPALVGSEFLASTTGVVATVALFLIVWRGAWGECEAVVAFGVFLGGILSSYIDQYYFRAGTEILFLRLGSAVSLETDLSLAAIVAGTIALAISALMGRFPRDRIGPARTQSPR